MSPLAWVVVLVILGVAVVWFLSTVPRLGRAVEEASEREDITPVLEAVDRLRPASRTAALNHAIRQLWDRYQRPLAIELVKVLAERHTDSLIAQYWLKQVMQVEPRLAKEHLDAEFVEAHFRPEVAARCGPVG